MRMVVISISDLFDRGMFGVVATQPQQTSLFSLLLSTLGDRGACTTGRPVDHFIIGRGRVRRRYGKG